MNSEIKKGGGSHAKVHGIPPYAAWGFEKKNISSCASSGSWPGVPTNYSQSYKWCGQTQRQGPFKDFQWVVPMHCTMPGYRGQQKDKCMCLMWAGVRVGKPDELVFLMHPDDDHVHRAASDGHPETHAGGLPSNEPWGHQLLQQGRSALGLQETLRSESTTLIYQYLQKELPRAGHYGNSTLVGRKDDYDKIKHNAPASELSVSKQQKADASTVVRQASEEVNRLMNAAPQRVSADGVVSPLPGDQAQGAVSAALSAPSSQSSDRPKMDTTDAEPQTGPTAPPAEGGTTDISTEPAEAPSNEDDSYEYADLSVCMKSVLNMITVLNILMETTRVKVPESKGVRGLNNVIRKVLNWGGGLIAVVIHCWKQVEVFRTICQQSREDFQGLFIDATGNAIKSLNVGHAVLKKV